MFDHLIVILRQDGQLVPTREAPQIRFVGLRAFRRLRGHRLRPGLGAEIETQLQLREPPVGLHGRARIALDRKIAVFERLYRQVVNHQMEKDAREEQRFGPWGAAIVNGGRRS